MQVSPPVSTRESNESNDWAGPRRSSEAIIDQFNLEGLRILVLGESNGNGKSVPRVNESYGIAVFFS
jgi:hypothetical protein